MPDSGEKSTAPIRGTGPERLAGGGGMDNNAAFLSPGAPASQFWLHIHLASALHRLLSAQPSPRQCATVQYRAAPEGVKLPARANKWNNNFHIINSSHGLRSISSHTLFIFDTLGSFYLCTPTHAKPNTIYSQMHSIMWVYLFKIKKNKKQKRRFHPCIHFCWSHLSLGEGGQQTAVCDRCVTIHQSHTSLHASILLPFFSSHLEFGAVLCARLDFKGWTKHSQMTEGSVCMTELCSGWKVVGLIPSPETSLWPLPPGAPKTGNNSLGFKALHCL